MIFLTSNSSLKKLFEYEKSVFSQVQDGIVGMEFAAPGYRCSYMFKNDGKICFRLQSKASIKLEYTLVMSIHG